MTATRDSRFGSAIQRRSLVTASPLPFFLFLSFLFFLFFSFPLRPDFRNRRNFTRRRTRVSTQLARTRMIEPRAIVSAPLGESVTLIAEGMIRGIAALQSTRAVAPTRTNTAPFSKTANMYLVRFSFIFFSFFFLPLFSSNANPLIHLSNLKSLSIPVRFDYAGKFLFFNRTFLFFPLEDGT